MIEFQDVTFIHQNGVKALDGVSLKIDSGETVAIVGENGAGKTTLVKHVTGLLKPTVGTVLVDGRKDDREDDGPAFEEGGSGLPEPRPPTVL